MAKLSDLERYKRDQDRFFAEMEAKQAAAERPGVRTGGGCLAVALLVMAAGASLFALAAAFPP